MRKIFASSPGWNGATEVDPEAHAVDAFAEPRNGRKQEEPDCRDAEEVAVRLEDAVVVAQHDERRH
jgi:hypothetical protein